MVLPVHMDLGLFLLRLGLGIIFLYHGWMKLKTPGMMAKGLGWQSWQVFLLGLVEVLGGLSVLIGVYAPYGALVFVLVMIGALYFKIVKWKTPFFAMDKMGWEFDLILLAASLAVFLGNVGVYALLP
ncbi:DoxX family protein [Candidatus Woesearchaeota archaeon]|nr:DoxX family protein [Candidatus Woesearchaeota archaeon]